MRSPGQHHKFGGPRRVVAARGVFAGLEPAKSLENRPYDLRPRDPGEQICLERIERSDPWADSQAGLIPRLKSSKAAQGACAQFAVHRKPEPGPDRAQTFRRARQIIPPETLLPRFTPGLPGVFCLEGLKAKGLYYFQMAIDTVDDRFAEIHTASFESYWARLLLDKLPTTADLQHTGCCC